MSIQNFDDFCLWMYVMIDDWLRQATDLPVRPGPLPTTCSDSELLTMVLVGECMGWHAETDLLRQWAHRADLFPRLPSLSRFHRRRRHLAAELQAWHQSLVAQMPWAQDPLLLLDSIPLAVVSRAHAAHASSDWRVHAAGYGYSPTKRLPFFGYRLHLLTTASGLILDWILTAAPVSDVAAAEDLLCSTAVPLRYRLILADKGYTSATLRARVQSLRTALLLVLPKRGMRAAQQLPLVFRRRVAALRQRIETLNSQLVCQFDAEQTTAHSFEGLCVRLRSKLTAHLTCVYANAWSGFSLDHALCIKHWVHPS